MQKLKLILSCLLAAAMSATLFACGDEKEESSFEGKELSEDTRTQIAQLAKSDERLTGDLENKTIKWLCDWDINADATGKSTPLDLAIFQERYGGVVEWHQTTYDKRYDDLANAINSDEGIDFFYAGNMDAFPKGSVRGMFVPYDDYIDLDSELWKDVKSANDQMIWNGSHYVSVVEVVGDKLGVIYNKKTIDEYGLDDPAELLADDEWDWDAFESMLQAFVDTSEGRYGIDSWSYEAGLSASTGVPYIGLENGKLVNNLRNASLERYQNWLYDMYAADYIALGNGDYGWSSKSYYIGEGKLLFYPSGLYELYKSPDQWRENFGEDCFFVPAPKDPEADEYYIAPTINAYCFVKGGHNPEGVAKYLDCYRFSLLNEEATKLNEQIFMDDYGWTEEMLEMKQYMDELAQENPTFDFYNGISSDVTDVLDSGEKGIRATVHGIMWNETVNKIYDQIDNFVNEVNENPVVNE